MNLVDEVNLAVTLAKFVLCVNEYQAVLCGDFLSALEELARIFLHYGVVFGAYDALLDDFLLGNVEVVTLVCLGCGRYDRLREPLVLPHSFGKLHSADAAAALFIFAPGRSGEYAAYDHLHAEAFTLQSDGHHGVGSGQFPVGAEVACGVEKLGRYLIEHLSLERDALGQDYVKGGNPVCSDHYHEVIVDVVNVAHLSVVHILLAFEVEVSTCQCFHCRYAVF